ncbi:hypothetical protein [Nocardiopsis composta]|uniref:MFS transporter n=1 Tax=Nocardiopsis composta TaxID=157465 RepID=A0A7W8QHS4_9ACTN|nr:hypothetical protein [Nocardiopsis composta]MBB5430591.1 hypothetical protein [Nocardiopsis composta]
MLPRGERGTAPPVPALSLVLVFAVTAAVSAAAVLPGTAAKAAALAAAAAVAAGFVLHERRSGPRVFPRATYRPGSPLKWVYLTIGLLTFGVAVESFLPLFGRRLGGLPPLAAGFFAAAVSLGWSAAQIGSSSAVREGTIRRLRAGGPLLLALGLLALGLLQREEAPLWLAVAWAPVLFAAGAGIGLAYPHLAVAAMSSVSDPEEGRRAAAAVAAVTTMSTALGTAVAGLLVNLGGDATLDAARHLLFGFAAICALGAATARAAGRSERTRAALPG